MSLEEKIVSILKGNLEPSQLEVVNISYLHKGHSGDDGSGETHFEIRIESLQFANKTQVACHRMVYSALEEGLETLPHALAIHTSAPK